MVVIDGGGDQVEVAEWCVIEWRRRGEGRRGEEKLDDGREKKGIEKARGLQGKNPSPRRMHFPRPHDHLLPFPFRNVPPSHPFLPPVSLLPLQSPASLTRSCSVSRPSEELPASSSARLEIHGQGRDPSPPPPAYRCDVRKENRKKELHATGEKKIYNGLG